jgi:hypothetical protein
VKCLFTEAILSNLKIFNYELSQSIWDAITKCHKLGGL